MKNLPTPDQLQPLVDAAHAIVAKRYPDSTSSASVRLSPWNFEFSVACFDIPTASSGLMVASGATPELCLANLQAQFDSLPNEKDRIAQLRAELAALEAKQ